MERPLIEQEILDIACEIARITRQILMGQAKPYGDWVQERAIELFVKLPPIEESAPPILVAIQDCLINILTCDNASWDTSIHGFQDGLERLERLLGERSHLCESEKDSEEC
ncbi:MAG: hypothetical protein KatS3mg020_0899 [Fimbriimonadales bacterium]|nr:MAG: hypothetical protein KatS3mg020_0899 [Fimbriimonadales bacterium]